MCNHDVIWLQVAVANVVSMQVFSGFEHLPHDRPYNVIIKTALDPSIRVTSDIPHELGQSLFTSVLKD